MRKEHHHRAATEPDHPRSTSPASPPDDRVSSPRRPPAPDDDKIIARARSRSRNDWRRSRTRSLELLGRDTVAKRAQQVLKPSSPRLIGTIADLHPRRSLGPRRPAPRARSCSALAPSATRLRTTSRSRWTRAISGCAAPAATRSCGCAEDADLPLRLLRGRARAGSLELRDAAARPRAISSMRQSTLPHCFPAGGRLQLAYGALSGDSPVLRGISRYPRGRAPPADRAAFAPEPRITTRRRAPFHAPERRPSSARREAGDYSAEPQAARRVHDDAGA